jgi:RNA polymerase sigma-70 factor (ECF subfamily)
MSRHHADRALREAFTRVVEQHGRSLWRLLGRAGVPPSGRLDLVQEVWIRLWKHFPELHQREGLWPWLRCVTYNLAVDYFRSAQRRERPCANPGAEMETETLDMDECLSAREVWNQVLATIEPQRRILFVMHEVEGMTAPEISEALGIPLGTVYSRLSRARAELDAGLAALRAAEEQRTGAVCLPLFFADVRTLIAMGSEVEPPSERTLHQIWTATLERIDRESAAPAPPAMPPISVNQGELVELSLAKHRQGAD